MIKLISTDFDGTLVNHDGQPAVVSGLMEMLAGLREEGVLWAVNTGRELDHIVEGLDMFGFSVKPDFVLTAEREVFTRGGNGHWADFGDWNAKCTEAHDGLFEQAQPLLEEIDAFLGAGTGAKPIFMNGRFVGVVATNDDEMDRVCEFIDSAREQMPLFSYQRNTLYLRFCHAAYSKGAALGELARLTGIGREEILAAGDHFNDIPMLDGRYARWVACPGNSVEPVKEVVRNAGGYVAGGVCSEGVLEALLYFGEDSRRACASGSTQ